MVLNTIKKFGPSALFTGVMLLYNSIMSEDKPKQVDKPYSLEKIYSVYKKYDCRIKEAVRDEKLTYKEIENLNTYLAKHLPYVKASEQEIYGELKGIANENKNDQLIDIINSLEDKVLCFYPELIKKVSGVNIMYNADKKIEKEKNALLISLAKKTKETLSNKYVLLEDLKNKKEWTISDLTAFYFFVKSTSEKSITKNLELKVPDLHDHKKIYEEYLEEWRYLKNNANKKFFSGNLIRLLSHYHDMNDCVASIESKLQPYTDKENLKAEYISDTIDFETKLPMWAWIPMSILGAGFMKFLITRYTKRKLDAGDGALEFGFNPGLGFLFADAIHPWAMPIRVFVLPIITEKIRSLTEIE